jgi:hypothetical protein
MRTVEVSAQEAIEARESIMALIRDAKARAALAEREAQERVTRLEVDSTVALDSTREKAEGFAQRIALLEGELLEAQWAQDVAEVNSQGMSDAAADVERQREQSERECQEWIEELTLLQTRGSELCLAIVNPPRVRSHLSEGMRLAALCHTEVADQLTVLRTVVSSATEFMLRLSPIEAF